MTEDSLADYVRARVPSLRTQAEYDALVMVVQALTLLMEATCSGEKTTATKAKEGLAGAIANFERTADISEKLREIPEAATSKEAQAFKTPPVQFTEEDTKKSLLHVLAGLSSAGEINEWYQVNRAELDKLVTPKHRNEVFDAIRAKVNAFSGAT